MRPYPQLATRLDYEKIEPYIIDPLWWADQKCDGMRLLLKVDNGVVSGFNRRGEKLSLPSSIKSPFGEFDGQWIFDGEHVNDRFWLFDLPLSLDRVAPEDPFSLRRTMLEGIYTHVLAGYDSVRLVPMHRTEDEKRHLVEWCHANNSEGVIFKRHDAPYQPGKRSKNLLKVKFTETADCVILEVGREGKESCSVGVMHEGTLVDVGSVALVGDRMNQAKSGGVIEVGYLYATEGFRLYQPTFIGFRSDKTWDECDSDQLKFVGKDIKEKV